MTTDEKKEPKKDPKKERKEDAKSGHIKELIDGGYICDCNDGKDYVFISYSSLNWKKVLYEIVYKTCKKYGLRVYFDTNFDVGSNTWITQFQDNMDDDRCKAVLAFISPEYYSSYATLMELMESQSLNAKGTLVLPIQLASGEVTSSDNTGLGTYRFADNSINELCMEPEMRTFNELFKELNDTTQKFGENEGWAKGLYTGSNVRTDNNSSAYSEALIAEQVFQNEEFWKSKGIYDEEEKRKFWSENLESHKKREGKIFLTKQKNAMLMQRLIAKVDKNKIVDKNKDFVDAIYGKLINEGLETVFDEALKTTVSVKTFTDVYKDGNPDVTDPVSGKLYHISGKKYDAYFTQNEDKTFTVLKGSRIAQGWGTYSSKDIIQRAEKIVDENGNLLEDITIKSQSSAAKFIKGISTNGSDILSEKNLVRGEERPTIPDTSFPLPTEQDRTDTDTGTSKEIETASADEEISGPSPVFGGDPKGRTGKQGKAVKMRLPEMIKCGIVSVGDTVYVNKHMSDEGILKGGDTIDYKGQECSLNKYVSEVLGPGSRNAYDFVIHKRTGKLLTELRDDVSPL